MKATVGVKLEEETRNRLKMLGLAKKRSPHWMMKEAIQEYLDREEAVERERREDMERWEQYVNTGEHITQEEMAAWFDSLVEGVADRVRS